VSDDDIFTGDVAGRLYRIDKRLRAARLDAQCRDWLAERPDRVGFARLGQAAYEVRTAAQRYLPIPPPDDPAWPFVGGAAWLGVTLLVLLAGDPAAPLTVALAAFAGMAAGQVAISALGWARSRRTDRRPTAAPADDPFLYADLTRRIEACAAAARADPRRRHRAAADDLGQALDWVSAARDEMAHGR